MAMNQSDSSSCRFLAASKIDSLSEDAPIIVGAPYDGAVTYRGGANRGPQAIREASDSIETYCPKFDADLEDHAFGDAGDLHIPDPTSYQRPKDMLDGLREQLNAFGQHPILGIGGDHLSAYPFITRALDQHPDLLILHLDAHADLRRDWEGEPFNHSTVLGRVVDVMGPKAKLVQWGIRSGLREEFQLIKQHPQIELLPHRYEAAQDRLRQIFSGSQLIYLTFDVDGLDPADIPGTGTPEPAGLRFDEVESMFCELFRIRTKLFSGNAPLVGADLVELAPALDPTGRSNVAAARLVRSILLLLSKQKQMRE